jgi:hypothetical protein
MKRFAVFSGEKYEPRGGWFDFRSSFDSLKDAEKYLLDEKYEDWYHIVDLVTGEVVGENK